MVQTIATCVQSTWVSSRLTTSPDFQALISKAKDPAQRR
jgi:hypothetical protein